MAKEKEELYELSLITTEGREVNVSYKGSMDEYDKIVEEIREALVGNKMFCSDNWINISMGGISISEIDFKKIIGINWY